MKAILYIVAIVAACGAIALSVIHSNRFKSLEKERAETISIQKEAKASNDAADKEIKDLKSKIATSGEAKERLEQSVSSLKSVGSSLNNDIAKLKGDLKQQDEEFGQLQKALDEVNSILQGLGDAVTIDALPEKIQQIEDDKKSKLTKLEELEVLISGSEKSLVSGRAELDRLGKRVVERGSRISRNAMEAVVTAVNQDWGFVVIGAGSNSSFSPQTDLLIQRDGRLIGRVKPSAVEPTQTIAEIDLDSLSSGVRILPGDRVILAQPAN